VAITIPSAKLQVVLERAVVLAESDAKLPDLWLERTARISASPSKTYIAALGTALLAKAADPAIDALTIKSKAGTNAYSMRGVVKVLAERAPDYGYHLGVTGPEPLNNQPWFGSSRVDRITNLRPDVNPFHRDLVRYLSDLNRLSSDEALLGLAAFLRLRLRYGDEERARAASLRVNPGGASFGDLLEVLEAFVLDDPEGGRRGQALVAAVLDLAHDDVELAAINDPRMFDVAVRDDGVETLGVDVKQKVVDESAVLHLAKEAAERSVDKVLLVALAPEQRALDRPRISQLAQEDHGVLASVYEGVRELLTQVALQSPLPVADFVRYLPEKYMARMQEHGVSAEGQQYWADLCSGLAA
jgi:SacI restriction endonuclease